MTETTKWREWWGERVSGPIPRGYVEVRDSAGRTRKGDASSFVWNVIGHRDDIRHYRAAERDGRFG